MQFAVGDVLEGKVTGITKFGAFVDLPGGKTGMVHISEIAPTYVNEIRDHVTENQVVKVKVLAITEEGKVSLSIKKAMERPPQEARRRPPQPRTPAETVDWNSNKQSENMSFEDMLSKFKQTSDDKISDLKKSMEVGKRSSGRRGYSK